MVENVAFFGGKNISNSAEVSIVG